MIVRCAQTKGMAAPGAVVHRINGLRYNGVRQ